MILACRNIEKGEKVRKQIVADCGNDNVKVLQLDLASLASIRQFAETVLSGKLHKTNNDQNCFCKNGKWKLCKYGMQYNLLP